MKRYWKAGIAAVALVVLAGAAVGLVAAQEDGNTPTPAAQEQERPKDRFKERLAENLGISVEELEQAIQQTHLDLLDEAVAEGRITEEQAAEIRERIESGEGPFFGKPHPRPHCRGERVVGEVAEFLGVSEADVLAGLQSGQTLAQIAEANGKTRDELKSFLLSEVEEKVTAAVENGRITQERADEILANSSERIDALIDREGLPEGPGRFKFDHELEPEDEAEGVGLIL